MFRLVIANRNYSSWSLRPWLFLTESSIPFEEIRIPLFTEGWQEKIARYSPAGRVPVLLDGDISVWDTMAIIEYVLESHPRAVGWPELAPARARARSISAEMHSGFISLRDELPQNIRVRHPIAPDVLTESCRRQIARIEEIWTDCRSTFGKSGDWLFGEFSIADVYYAPVALRFLSYSISLNATAREYIDTVRELESVQQWTEEARKEQESLPFIDDRVPSASSPLTLG